MSSLSRASLIAAGCLVALVMATGTATGQDDQGPFLALDGPFLFADLDGGGAGPWPFDGTGDNLEVVPVAPFSAAGAQGGPFTPPVKSYMLTNNGIASIPWTATASETWFAVNPVGGTLAGYESALVTVSLTAAANSLLQGAYTGAATFANTGSGVAQTRNVSLDVTEPLTIVPADGLSSAGHPGGPFTPESKTYTMTNQSQLAIDWTATADQAWVVVTPSGGTLAGGADVSVTVTFGPDAAALEVGQYTATVTIEDGFSNVGQTRPVSLRVVTEPVIWIDPASMSEKVLPGGQVTRVLTIGNIGDRDLHFTLTDRETGRSVLGPIGKSPVRQASGTPDCVVFEYSFQIPTVAALDEYDLLSIEGLKQYERAGAPVIPARPATILVPCSKDIVSVDAEALDVQQLDGAYTLPPGQQPYPLSYTGALAVTKPDPAIYAQSTPWPGKTYETLDVQSKRGYKLLRVNLFPLQYTPASKTVSVATAMRVTVTLTDAAPSALLRPTDLVRGELETAVDNPAALDTYGGAELAQGWAGYGGPSALLAGGPFEYVIITSQALSDAPGPYNFQALRDLRASQGHTGTIVATEWIYANYPGTRPDGGADNQTRIRNFLIDAYATWGTQYVLIGGNNAVVPARLFYVNSLAGEIDYMPVDMYYGCVDPVACTFDSDADGKYGEPTDGVGGADVDLMAEIYVGRAAVDTAAELANFVRKTMAYDSTADAYLPLITMLGEYLGFGGVSNYATASMEQIRLGSTADGYTTVGFENHTQPDICDFDTSVNLYDASGYSWSKTQLIALMNGGKHVFNHLGHSNQTYCAKLYTSDLTSLTNTQYFFMYSQGCEPGWFDSTNCFAEVLTSMANGAFAVVMNARFGWGRGNSTDGPSQRFDRQFWDAVLEERMLEMGRANQDSKEDNLWDINGGCIRWCYYELNLFGDPIQPLRVISDCPWIAEDPTTGTVPPGGTMNVDVTLLAGTLPLGTYQGEIAVHSDAANDPNLAVPVTMIIAADILSIAPTQDFVSSGPERGPFTPDSATYTLTNTDPAIAIEWSADNLEEWLDVSPNTGTLDPGASVAVDVRLNVAAASLPQGLHRDTVTFLDESTGFDQQRAVVLSVTEPLVITPPDAFTAEGPAGGPFNPDAQTYTLANEGSMPIDWTAANTAAWTSLSKSGGTLDPGASDTVVVSLTPNALDLFPGIYPDRVTFEDLTTGTTLARDVTLVAALYWEPLDTDPGWTTQGQWQFGAPHGAGTAPHDPAAPHTGTNVYGYNLDGDYANSIPVYYLTTSALDCSGYTDLKLHFWRWLDVDASAYDSAKIQVSKDGTAWTDLWVHSGSALLDARWVECTVALPPAIADDRPQVYLRWAMGPANGTVTYPGWNLDDIALAGTAIPLRVVPRSGLSASGPEGGPFTPSHIAYTVSNHAGAPLAWTAEVTQNWIDVAPSGGTLDPGQSTVVDVAFSANVLDFPASSYADTLTFTDATNGGAETRAIALTIGELPAEPTNPGPADGATNVSPFTALTWAAGAHPPRQAWYVDVDNVGGPRNGLSWPTAFPSVQQGVDAAAQQGGEVWVKRGTYSETIAMKSGVALYGGFAGSETDRDQRDPRANLTTIDATTVSPRYHVVSINTVTNVRLDGFTITGGNANSSVWQDKLGAGISCISLDNTATIANCTVTGNTALERAGGIYFASCSSPLLADCVVADNSSSYGGAIYCAQSAPAVIRCVVSANTAPYGGGFLLDAASPTVVNCLVSGNISDARGGGFLCDNASSPVIINCTLCDNVSNWLTGGAMFVANSSCPVLKNCMIVRNGGYGIYERTTDADPVLTNCLFRLNGYGDYYDEYTTTLNGAAAINALPGNSGNVDGDPRFMHNSPFAITGVWIAAPVYDAVTGRTTMTAAADAFDPGALVGRLINGDVNTGYEGFVVSNTSSMVIVAGDATHYVQNGDTFRVIDYHLELGSAAIDAGTGSAAPATDIEGLPRPVDVPGFGAEGTGTEFDIGAYEAQIPPPAVYYVDSARPDDSGSGASWGEAKKTIQAAINAAAWNSEIWVKQGTYPEAVTMKAGVCLYGGFAGMENAREQRDWAANETTIDGENVRRCVVGAAGGALDGFVITRGNAAVLSSHGGGLYNVAVSPAVSNCRFVGNTALRGGAMMNRDGAAPVIANCVFDDNSATDTIGGGAAVYNYFNSSPTISGCTFTNNHSYYGAGVHNVVNAPVITDCVFTGNVVQQQGGAIFNDQVALTLRGCTFENNAAVTGGAIINRSANLTSITDCTFTGNEATYGGAMYNSVGAPAVSNCVFQNNAATSVAGAVYNNMASTSLVNCIFLSNTSASAAGAVFNENASTPTILNCTFARNDAAGAAGIHNKNGVSTVVTNTILWDLKLEIANESSTPTVTYSDVRGGYTGEGNIDADPLFVDADAGNVQLQSGSPCVDTGTAEGAPADDIAGAPRPQGDGYDMGAYEFGAGLLSEPPGKVAAAIWYVDFDNTSGHEDGKSWATAFRTIQQGISAAASGDQVWVAEGAYVSTSGNHVIVMAAGVQVYGGFAGTETLLGQRDWNVHPTVIDGQQRLRCVYFATTGTLDGFTITRGKTDPAADQYYGGAMMVRGGGAATVSNCIFADNWANRGGAIEIDSATLNLSNCIFVTNTASDMGGAIYNYTSGVLNMANCTFTANSATSGAGGIYRVTGSSGTAVNCILWADTPTELAGSATFTVTYSDVQGGYSGTGNINANPLFIDPANTDLRLGNGSPCIDKGTLTGAPPTDIRRIPRPQGAAVDIGAYEALNGGGACEPVYDVYFDTVNPPVNLLCEGTLARTCLPGTLEPVTTYYWRVVARDCYGETAGPVWSFTTVALAHVVDVTSQHPDGAFRQGEIIDIDVAFSIPVSVTGVPKLRLETGVTDRDAVKIAASDPAIVRFRYTVAAGDLSPDLDYINTTAINLSGGAIRDAATNTLDVDLTLPPPGTEHALAGHKNILVDAVVPSVVISTSVSDPTNAPIPVIANFSEPVMRFTADDVAATNAAVADFSGAGADYTFTLVPLAQGLVTASIPAGAAEDLAGNVNTASLQISRSYDGTAPSGTMTSLAPDPTNVGVFSVTVALTEPVIGLTDSAFVVTNGFVVRYVGSDTGCTFDVLIAGEGLAIVELPADTVHDAAGNILASALQLTRTYDNQPPTGSMTSTAPDPTNTEIPVTVTFSEPVFGFDPSIIAVTNGAVTAFGGSGANYSFILLPAGGGQVSATITPYIVRDAAGNVCTQTLSLSRTFDAVPPTGTMTSSVPDPTRSAPIPVTVVFSKTVIDFTQNTILLTNATVGGFSGSGADYRFDLVPSAQGAVGVEIPEGALHDAAGNAVTTTLALSRTYDSIPPVGAMASTAPDPTNAAPVPVTLTFTEPVPDFTQDVIIATNASVDGFGGAGANWRFDLTPLGQGLLAAEIPVGAIYDAAGNSNTATLQLGRAYDSVPPTGSLTSAAPDPTNAAPIPVTLTFTEPVSGITQGAITVTNGVIGDFTGIGANYQFSLTPSGQGAVVAELPAGVAFDAAGNANTPTLSVSRVYDSMPPTAAISLKGSSPTSLDAVAFTVVFNEDVGDTFTASRVATTGSLGGAVSVNGAASPYTVVVMLDDPNEDGTIGIRLTNGICDAAGNACAETGSACYRIHNWFGFVHNLANAELYIGDSHALRVEVAHGNSTPVFQWMWEEQSGAYHMLETDDACVLTNVTEAQQGDYWCVVTYDSVPYCSNTATVTVKDHVRIALQPEGAERRIGESHTFSVQAAGGYPPLHYAWHKDGAPVASGETYTIASLQESDSGTYSVVVSDANNDEAESAAVDLSVTLGMSVAGFATLGALAALCALFGVARLSRKR